MKIVKESLFEILMADILKPRPLSNDEELKYAMGEGDIERFKRAIENGAKIDFKDVKNLIYAPWVVTEKRDNPSYKLNKSELKELKKWNNKKIILSILKNKLENKSLYEIIKFKDLEKTKILLNIKEPMTFKSYPGGYKLYRLLKYVDEDEVYKLRQLTKFIYELNFGEDTFNPLKKWKLLSRFMGRNVMALC